MNKAGSPLDERYELYDFVVQELLNLERLEPHRIMAIRVLLENKKVMALNFVNTLNYKFKHISLQFTLPLETIWEMFKLQRCKKESYLYVTRSAPLQWELKERFGEVEEAVVQALDSTERTSSMVENLNGRVRKYLRHRQDLNQGYLDLLRFFLNHKPLIRSTRVERHGKTPAEIMLGTPHRHWLELLGFKRFQRCS